MCRNPECSHDEPNFVAGCAVCGNLSLLIRNARTIPPGSVVGYCPLCGITVLS